MTTESNESEQRTARFSPNGIQKHRKQKACNHNGCESQADWDINLIDRHGCNGLFRVCDDHVEEHYGYHPEDQ